MKQDRGNLSESLPNAEALLKSANKETAKGISVKAGSIIDKYFDTITILRQEKNFGWKEVAAFLRKHNIEISKSSLQSVYNRILKLRSTA